jgi:hypothetical protein
MNVINGKNDGLFVNKEMFKSFDSLRVQFRLIRSLI